MKYRAKILLGKQWYYLAYNAPCAGIAWTSNCEHAAVFHSLGRAMEALHDCAPTPECGILRAVELQRNNNTTEDYCL